MLIVPHLRGHPLSNDQPSSRAFSVIESVVIIIEPVIIESVIIVEPQTNPRRPDCLPAYGHSPDAARPDAAHPDRALGAERHAGGLSVSGAIPGIACGRPTLGASSDALGIPSRISVGAVVDGLRSLHSPPRIVRAGDGCSRGIWFGPGAGCPV